MITHITLVAIPKAQKSRGWVTLIEDIRRYFNSIDIQGRRSLLGLTALGEYAEFDKQVLAVSYMSEHDQDKLGNMLNNIGYTIL